MANKIFKRYGRTEINKLDWLLAISFCLFAISALWISLGISISNAGEACVEAFKIFARGLGFIWDASKGPSVITSVCVTFLVYVPLFALIVGAISFTKTGYKGRIPGLVACFVAFVGVALLACFVFELTAGSANGVLQAFWPWSLTVLISILALVGLVSLYIALNKLIDVSFAEDDEIDDSLLDEPYLDDDYVPEEERKEDEIAQEEVEEENQQEEAEETVEEVEKAPVEEEPVVEEEAADEVVEEEVEETEEELEEDQEEAEEVESEEEGLPGNKFNNLGPRRKNIPFQNKVKNAKPETKARYKQIVTALRFFQFNDRMSIPCETFSYKKEKMVILTFSGKTLKAYFRLNPNDYVDSPIPVIDASNKKKYAETPTLLVIKSDLAARRVIKLAERIIEEHNIPKK